MNAAARRLFEREPEPHGTSLAHLLGPQADALVQASRASRPGRVEATIPHGAGLRHLDLTVNMMRAGAEGWIGIASIRDVTDQRVQLDTLRRMASEDPLTGLANRLAFERALADACAEPDVRPAPGGGPGPASVAVLLCDLDGFKAVNDTLGHQAGDVLLREIAQRLVTAAGPALVARLGGDEFALLARGGGAATLRALAEGLVAAVARPISLEDRPVSVGISVGVALAAGDERVPAALVRAADAAMYRAKRARTGVAFARDEAA